MEYFTIKGDEWIVDMSLATSFFKRRLGSMVRNGYLLLDRTDHHVFVFKVVGSQKEYDKATEHLLEGHGDEAHIGGPSANRPTGDDGGTGTSDE